MNKRADSAPREDSGDCKPSKGLLDELSTLEAMLEQREGVDEEAKKEFERASKDDQRE